jgi:DNA-binding Xre family transcriptional regulator
MARNFRELQAKMSPEARAKSEAQAQRALELMTLHELRRERKLSQTELANGMHLSQGDISRIENRSDMKLSTLDNFVNALGGTLEIHAIFPEKTIALTMGHEEA